MQRPNEMVYLHFSVKKKKIIQFKVIIACKQINKKFSPHLI